jgi:hypothetical protein
MVRDFSIKKMFIESTDRFVMTISWDCPLNPPILGDFQTVPPKVRGLGGLKHRLKKQRQKMVIELGITA